MSFDYKTLKSLPEDLSLGVMIKFLIKTKNSRLRPGVVDSDCPPIFFWWYEEENEEINEFVNNAVKTFQWKDRWTIENKGNGKWLLFPEYIRDAERLAKGLPADENVEVTDAGVAWLMKKEPEFGRRANQDLDQFRIFFRKRVEDYLKEKEEIK